MYEYKRSIVFIDVETTGLYYRKGSRIIEIGAVQMKENQIVSEYQSLIAVDVPIPMHASEIHGITNEMLTGQPRPEGVFPEVKDFIADSILVAHNAKFDISFLRQEFARLGMKLNNKFISTLETSRSRYPRLPNYKLSTIYRHLVGELPADAKPHRALTDTRMVAAIWMAMEGK